MSPSWHRPQLSVSEPEARRGETVGDSCDADRGGGHSALRSHNSHLLHLKLTSPHKLPHCGEGAVLS